MGDIFKKAEGMIVGLGKDDESTDDAPKTMSTIATTSENDWSLVPYTSFYESDKSQCLGLQLSFYNWLGYV
jgi:hypothetical protein